MSHCPKLARRGPPAWPNERSRRGNRRGRPGRAAGVPDGHHRAPTAPSPRRSAPEADPTPRRGRRGGAWGDSLCGGAQSRRDWLRFAGRRSRPAEWHPERREPSAMTEPEVARSKPVIHRVHPERVGLGCRRRRRRQRGRRPRLGGRRRPRRSDRDRPREGWRRGRHDAQVGRRIVGAQQSLHARGRDRRRPQGTAGPHGPDRRAHEFPARHGPRLGLPAWQFEQLEAFCDEAAAAYEELESLGILDRPARLPPLLRRARAGHCTQRPADRAAPARRRRRGRPGARPPVAEAAEERGVAVRVEHRVTAAVLDEDGRVAGVVASTPTGTTRSTLGVASSSPAAGSPTTRTCATACSWGRSSGAAPP